MSIELKITRKKLARPKVNFENATDLEAVVLAKLGMGRAYIQAQTQLTSCQIGYRLTKGKNAEGLPKGIGYSTAYRSGQGAIAREVLGHFVPTVRKEAKATLPKLFVHPTPEVAKAA